MRTLRAFVQRGQRGVVAWCQSVKKVRIELSLSGAVSGGELEGRTRCPRYGLGRHELLIGRWRPEHRRHLWDQCRLCSISSKAVPPAASATQELWVHNFGMRGSARKIANGPASTIVAFDDFCISGFVSLHFLIQLCWQYYCRLINALV